MRKDRSERVVKYLPTETALYRPDPSFWQMVWIYPSRHAIFSEYSVSVPLALQCSGHPGKIYGTF